MISLFSGGIGVGLRVDREVDYAEAEVALKRHGFKSFNVNRTSHGPQETELHLHTAIPVEEITADGVPQVDAADALRRLAAVVEDLDKGIK
ncbi:hypothetical protein AB0C38_31790 [Amycolatopsis sp. NPDC048633]|uniref:hypothetical protein n=1 Tax=Amycolatopsis sp. NPDC048633 TaxID=3157095 RepID=UPI0033DEF95A